jgi:integrase
MNAQLDLGMDWLAAGSAATRSSCKPHVPAAGSGVSKVIHPRYRALVVVGAYGGLRIGELAGLRRARVDLLRGGGPLQVRSFRARFWVPATRAAGVNGLRIHDLRHTAVALWIAAGATPKEVAVRAGHTSVSFTLDRYGHLPGI